MQVRIRSAITLQDYTAFNFFALKKRLILLPMLLFILFPALMLVTSLLTGDPYWLTMLLLTLFIAMLFAGLIALVNYVSIRSASKKQYRSSKAMQAESELVIDEAGLRESSEYGSNVVVWEDVLRADEADTAYYVFFSRMQALVVLKRLLSPEEEKALRQLFSAHLPEKKVRLKKLS